ncbi:MAG: response regulator, partial [Oscillospiraceae bacterium]|nr:response regulator [Oscillospiraceae bacterium]
MNILVCDDDHEIVDAVAIYLKNEGYSVLKAYDGVDALEKLAEGEVHLIIMDVMMPRMDGMRALSKLREERNIPVILLSAKAEDTDKIMGLHMGADDYITKPF